MKEKEEISGYQLSHDWFDFCYENPELICPTHTAMYFFIIDHWNRMGWKVKFGLPMEMTKDALGIKNYKTYSRIFNDLVKWGFIIIVQKSTNQYSANIIALVKNTKASTKALTKASTKHMDSHLPKQVQSNCQGIVGIDKLRTIELNNQELKNNTISNEKVEIDKNWKNDFDIYLEDLRSAYLEIKTDLEFIKQQESFYQNVDILKSIEKACVNYWSTPAGWKKKKQSRILDINWKSTFANAISLNKVYNGNSNLQPTTGFGNQTNKSNTFRNDAEKRNAECADLKALSLAILQQS